MRAAGILWSGPIPAHIGPSDLVAGDPQRGRSMRVRPHEKSSSRAATIPMGDTPQAGSGWAATGRKRRVSKLTVTRGLTLPPALRGPDVPCVSASVQGVTFATLVAVSRALGVTLAELLEGV
jgi:hypothetical protein